MPMALLGKGSGDAVPGIIAARLQNNIEPVVWAQLNI
jgi:hypothetical protein